MRFHAVAATLFLIGACHGSNAGIGTGGDDDDAPDAGAAGDAGTPQRFAPQIFVIDSTTGDLIAPTAAVTAEAPMSVHVSAIPEITDHPCVWDPTAWRAAGEKNLCDLDRSDYAVSTTLGSDLGAFFGSGVAAPQNVETDANPSMCLLLPPGGAAYDPTTIAMIKAVSNCVRDRDEAFDTQVSHAYLGDSDLANTQFAWDFGDPGSPFNTVGGITAAHVFSDAGKTYTVTLTVTTEWGDVATTTMQVATQASTRQEIRVRTQADFNALATANGASARWIRLLRGANFHLTAATVTLLGANDWVTSYSETNGVADAVATGPLPIITIDIASEIFAFAGGAHDVVVEQFQIAGGLARGQIAGIHGPNNVVFRDIPFMKIGKGFDIAGDGILIENVGTPPDANGNWISDDLTSNFSISTGRALAFYGNHFFVGASSGDGEPGVRSNGDELFAFVGNELGGSIGKLDTMSFRGTKHVYVGYNQLRGGVDNIQWGTSQDPQPQVMPIDLAFEGNETDNNTIVVGEAVRDVSIRNNIMRIHKVADPTNRGADPYYALFPWQSNYLIEVNGYGMTALEPRDIFVTNNTMSFEETATSLGGASFVINYSTNVTLVNNIFYSPAIVPFHFWNTSSPMAGLARVAGNAFFVPTTTAIGPVGGSITAWNATPLSSGAVVADQQFTPAQASINATLANTDDVAGVRPAAASPIAATGVNLTPSGDPSNKIETYAVTTDITLAARPATGGWTPGAVQVTTTAP